jgi:predicted small secreted protein
MKKFRALIVIGTLLLAVSACNTINGIGKDVKKAGEKVEEVSKK